MKRNIKISLYAAFISIILLLIITLLYTRPSYKKTKYKYAPDNILKLTESEQQWLNDHPNIVFGYTDSFEPLVIRNKNGKLSGIMVDALNTFNQRLNANFQLQIDTWPKTLAKAKNKEIDVVLLIKPSLADTLGLLKTNVTASDYPTFFTRRGAPFSITKLDDVKGRRIAVLKSVAYVDEILAPYITTVNLIECTSGKMLMQLVSDGSADMALSLASQIFTIAKYRYTKVDPSYTLWNYPVNGVMGVRSDWPELVSILNKALANFSQEERNALYSKWGVLQYKKSFDYSLLWKFIYGILLIIVFFTWSNIRLRKAVLKRTKELELTELQYRNLFESANDAIFILKGPYIHMCNQKSAQLFGFEKEKDVIGLSIHDISPEFQPDGKTSVEKVKEIKEQIKQGTPQSFEWKHVRKDGEFFYADVTLAPVLIQGASCLLAIIRDISKKKKVKADLIAAKEKAEESDRLKTAFLAGISHEIHTPMNGILGFAELLKSPDISHDEKQEFVELIELSGKRMIHLIDDLVDMSKIESGELELLKNQTCINNIIDEVHGFFTPHANNKNIILKSRKELKDELSIVYIDKEKITQVLINLIANAFKFTDEGFIEFGYKRKGDVLEFFIKDTGIGVEPAMHNVIFERFRQVDIRDSSKHEGSGLGLSISKAFIEKHGGRIWVDSEPNKGSAFYFTLPYRQK